MKKKQSVPTIRPKEDRARKLLRKLYFAEITMTFGERMVLRTEVANYLADTAENISDHEEII